MKKNVFVVIILVTLKLTAQTIDRTGSSLTPEEATTFLAHHNLVREEVGVPNLEWDNRISASAQKYAEYLASRNCGLVHSQKRDLGENLYWTSASDYNIVDASISFYKEKEDYSYSKLLNGSNKKGKVIGHYTQMIWKNTKKIGVGSAPCKCGGYVVVAQYYPPGNYIGEYPY